MCVCIIIISVVYNTKQLFAVCVCLKAHFKRWNQINSVQKTHTHTHTWNRIRELKFQVRTSNCLFCLCVCTVPSTGLSNEVISSSSSSNKLDLSNSIRFIELVVFSLDMILTYWTRLNSRISIFLTNLTYMFRRHNCYRLMVFFFNFFLIVLNHREIYTQYTLSDREIFFILFFFTLGLRVCVCVCFKNIFFISLLIW